MLRHIHHIMLKVTKWWYFQKHTLQYWRKKLISNFLIINSFWCLAVLIFKSNNNCYMVYTVKCIETNSIRGLVSGATTMTPCCAANCWKPDFVMKFCSVQVRPRRNIQTMGGDSGGMRGTCPLNIWKGGWSINCPPINDQVFPDIIIIILFNIANCQTAVTVTIWYW